MTSAYRMSAWHDCIMLNRRGHKVNCMVQSNDHDQQRLFCKFRVLATLVTAWTGNGVAEPLQSVQSGI